MKRTLPLALLLCLLTACGGAASPPPAVPPTQALTQAPTLPPASTIVPSLTPTPYPTPDLSERPMVWFAPLPPLRMDSGRPFTGAEDYMQLFEPQAPWQTSAGRIAVFSMFAEWVNSASDEQLQAVIDFTRSHGIALGMGDAPIPPQSACGSGMESVGGTQVFVPMAERIKRLGGELRFVEMDEPYYQYSLNDAPGACRWSADKLARKLDTYIKTVQRYFPQAVVGDIEVLHKGMDPVVYEEWLVAFRETNGYELPFLHMDVDYARQDWAERLVSLEQFSDSRGVDFGIIFFGNWDDLSDETWLANTGERLGHYEAVSGGLPEHVLFESWQDHPDRSLPESDPTTFTGFLKTYFEDRASLGFRGAGAGANLAYGKAVRASRTFPDQPVGFAVDGDPGTFWSAGDFAPQWIEVDLGAAYPVSEIRLRLSQDPAGRTVHRVYTRGTGGQDVFILRGTFDGETKAMDLLSLSLPAGLQVRYVRVETGLSPSWIGFSEIEVIAGE